MLYLCKLKSGYFRDFDKENDLNYTDASLKSQHTLIDMNVGIAREAAAWLKDDNGYKD